MNVHDYFIKRLNYVPYDDFMGDDMPINSECGQDCVAAIDAAAAMLHHVEQAYGNRNDPHCHPKSVVLSNNIIDTAKNVVECYIYG